ncbi:DUF3693 domain-containing protein [Xylella taiwanensis]|uniref:DUF3693 domain-containing protein n=1 Tax=Xylella taiwanensis TaxID=1444770 RepID=A0ABS8TYN0_9GAMM|nr:DUF3693 domain-containing protein [Xylella taiwanensis]MCD8456672.1 DUF3693 domain-containing protein [Xylella taiwanensis]MCD8459079.1 DUF3693 domain-containing protein [Xylella taiwanensis]MCD8464169.1 DUF3693 domain-containing protein [Xylella taiwanensis]MCD8465723.1 DUF3693 domain-containing protein [Xylella taiwanensis]MCD8474015.1 DUF3693 domain-containing protein [Xylella taiwanensis]
MAAINLAKEDPALAVLIRQESAESETEKKGWSTLWQRLSAATNVAMAASANEAMREEMLVGRAGIEPATSGLKVRQSEGTLKTLWERLRNSFCISRKMTGRQVSIAAHH